MASTLSSLLRHKTKSVLASSFQRISRSSSLHHQLSSNVQTTIRRETMFLSTVAAANSDITKPEDIVIVGGGVAGLATAVALRRLGIKSTVLEQADSIRTQGVSVTLSKNAWTALDAIGVADELREQFLEMQGILLRSQDGKELKSFKFKEEDQSQEIRAVERRSLLGALANQLPPDAFSFSSKLEKIESQSGETLLKLQNGAQLSAKILIACDGVHSPVAKWMGFSEPKYAGHCVLRGLGVYPNGQPFEPVVNYNYGRGVRAGFVPLSQTKVFWFICYNSSSPGPRITDPSVLKEQAAELLKTFPPELLTAIERTPDDCIVKSPLVDRWLWPIINPPPSTGNVVLVGDAWHPMTPNLGQGACCALEDSVVLAKKLADALKRKTSSVADAFKAYGDERWPRVFPITIRANFAGKFLQWDNSAVCALRDNIIIPKLLSVKRLSQQTHFKFERLE